MKKQYLGIPQGQGAATIGWVKSKQQLANGSVVKADN